MDSPHAAQAEALDFGNFLAKLVPQSSGDYALHVHVASAASRCSIPGSPFSLTVVGAHAPVCQASVSAHEARAATVNHFRVSLFTRELEPVDDEGGDNGLAISFEYIDGPAERCVTCFAPGDGRGDGKSLGTSGWWVRTEQGVYTVMYRPHRFGKALIHITVGGVPIAGCPLHVSIVAGRPDRMRCKVQGEGLERASCMRPATFTIIACDATGLQVPDGGARFTATICPFGSELSDTFVAVEDNRDGTYTGTYTVNVFGQYHLTVLLDARPLPTMPSKVLVPGPDLKRIQLSGKGLSEAVPGEEATFEIVTFDTSGQPLLVGGCDFSGVLERCDGSKTTVRFTDREDGSYRGSYTATLFGEHNLSVTMGPSQQLLRTMPRVVQILGPGINQCKLEGMGLRVAKVGIVASFTIMAHFADGRRMTIGGCRFAAIVVGSTEKTIVDIQDNRNGTYSATYRLNSWGDFTLSVTLDGQQLPEMPYTVEVHGGPEARASTASGPGLQTPTSDHETEFTVWVKCGDGTGIDLPGADASIEQATKSAQLQSLGGLSSLFSAQASHAPKKELVRTCLLEKLCEQLLDKVDLLSDMIMKIDKDGDGTLSAKELQLGLGEIGLNLTEVEAEQAIGDLDTDGSGSIDHQELLQLMQPFIDAKASKRPELTVPGLSIALEGGCGKLRGLAKGPRAGEYIVTWLPLRSGDNVITIKVCNDHVDGSPFTVAVQASASEKLYSLQPAFGCEISVDGSEHGVRILSVKPGGPSDKAGIVPNENLKRIDGALVNNTKAFESLMLTKTPGDRIHLTIVASDGHHERVVPIVAAARGLTFAEVADLRRQAENETPWEDSDIFARDKYLHMHPWLKDRGVVHGAHKTHKVTIPAKHEKPVLRMAMTATEKAEPRHDAHQAKPTEKAPVGSGSRPSASASAPSRSLAKSPKPAAPGKRAVAH